MTSERDTKPVFQLKTINGKVFRCLSDSLRAVLNNANLVINENGLKMTAMDVNDLGAMLLEMPAAAFESFEFSGDPIMQGINIVKLAKILKICNVKDKLSLAIYKDRRRLEVVIENAAEHKRYVQHVALDEFCQIGMSLPPFEIQPPEMTSVELLKICRQMTNVGCKTVDIQMINDDLSFTGGGGGDTDPGFFMKIGPPSTADHMVGATFQLNFLQTFAKASEISSKVKLHIHVSPGMKPLLMLEYEVSGMGVLRYLLPGNDVASSTHEHSDEIDDDYDQDGMMYD